MGKTPRDAERDGLPELTKPELEIMKSLWRSSAGRLAAREIHDQAGEANGWAYSTTRTTIERMVKKGLLQKKEFHGLNLYETEITRVRGLASWVRDFAERIVEMDPAPVVSLFAEAETLSRSEIAELHRLLDESEEE